MIRTPSNVGGDPEGRKLFADVGVDARPYQERIVHKATQMFRGTWVRPTGETDPAAHSVMIESPTGSGKTVMGLAVARWLEKTYGYRVGWVAMRRNLLAQAMEENCRRGFDVDLRLISMFDRDPPAVDALVVDEAQHDAAMSMSDLHARLQPKKILGLTATPFRTDRIKLCFEKVIQDAGIQPLLDEGYLSPYRHFSIPEYTPERVAATYLAEPDRWGKTLIFFHRREQCVACQGLLEKAGVKTEVVTADSPRERQLDDFAAGRTNVLLNMAILTEGFDCPTLKTVFCRPSGKGCTIQMGGRVFRKHAAEPVKQIVQCVETRHPFLKTARPVEQYLWRDGTWRSLTVNKQLTEITHRAMRLVAAANVSLPKLVTQHRDNTPEWLRPRRRPES